MKRSRGGVPVLVVCLVIGVAGLSLWCQAPYFSAEPAKTIGNLLIDAGFCATALLLIRQDGQRINAALAGLVSLTSLASHALSRDIGVLAAPAYIASSFTQVLGGVLILRYPGSGLDRWGRLWSRANLSLAGVFGVVLMLMDTPAWWTRIDIDNGWPNPWLDVELNWFTIMVRSYWRFVLALTFVLLLVRRYRRLGRLERHTLMPIAWAALFSAAVIAADLVQWWIPPVATQDIQIARSYLGAVVAGGFVWSALRLRFTSSNMTGLVTALSGPTSLSSVRRALSRALEDDTLRILYWVADKQSFVDENGTVKADPSGGSSDRLIFAVHDSDGGPLAVIDADSSLRRHADLVQASVTVGGIALENARLQAGLQAQLLEVREARTRLLDSGLAQRRQLERDLHDGAQQRLLALGMRLSHIETLAHTPTEKEGVRAAHSELREAMVELRDLAHGIYPAILSQGGLSAALEAVAERSPISVTLDVPPRRWPSSVESVAYMVVCEALTNAVKHAHSPTAEVLVKESPEGELILDVWDHGDGWDLTAGPPQLPQMSDRLGALGGHLLITSGEYGTRVNARIPLPLNET